MGLQSLRIYFIVLTRLVVLTRDRLEKDEVQFAVLLLYTVVNRGRGGIRYVRIADWIEFEEGLKSQFTSVEVWFYGSIAYVVARFGKGPSKV